MEVGSERGGKLVADALLDSGALETFYRPDKRKKRLRLTGEHYARARSQPVRERQPQPTRLGRARVIQL